MECKLGSKKFTAEIKLDFLACKTSNMAIEIENPVSGKLTGLNVTTADLWFTLIKDSENWTIFATRTEHLRDYVKKNVGRRIERVGDGNSTILLYPLDNILGIFKRIDDLVKMKDNEFDYSEITKVIKGLLKK